MIQSYLKATVLRKATLKYISMAWYCSGSTNAELVENLFRTGLVKNERVKKAMLGVSGPFNF
jgi:protein-L-isoaspartate(D-aspartate) O-methyltransferase